MEARFISVSSNFLEKIGLDVDVIFNQNNSGYDLTGSRNTFGDPGLVGSGPWLLQPRPYSYNGALPATPAGSFPPPTGWGQPYGHPGLVPVGNPASGTNNWTPIPMLNNSNSLVTPQNTSIPGNLASSAATPAFQVMGAFMDDIQVNFLLEATQMDKYSSIVQAPRVVMQNGTEGVIQVGTYQPEVGNIQQVVGTGAAGAEEGEERGVFFGTMLRITATTTDLRYVNMYLRPRISAPAPEADITYFLPTVAGGTTSTLGSTGGTSSSGGIALIPITRHGKRVQALKTEVSVPDGGTLLVGGLKQSGEIEIEAGPPVLSKIPVFKRLFANKATTRDNFTLMVLVKPKIIVREESEANMSRQIDAFK
jgi:type II secretory pathway component GspD/PulD (secretin)